ncbi:MAG TPA: hypothetical protein VK742_09340 [Candidatus Sulfotelmatobacter sp.]|jgi:hypothetical protein|nr:hypothetical protein [Candidatus Sulfotelmatobacter sp.]
MTARTLTKAQLKEVRKLAGMAYERELAKAVGDLQEQFESWRRGEMDVFALNERIHQFHDGVSRNLYKQYVFGEADWNLATAIRNEVVKESEVNRLILENLGSLIDLGKQFADLGKKE